VQFQPRRSGGLTPDIISELMLRIALNTGVRAFSVERSPARNSYLNFLFTSATAARTWRALRRQVLNHRNLGERIRGSTIVTCEGTRGWDNYLLLHHFHPKQRLDKLAERLTAAAADERRGRVRMVRYDTERRSRLSGRTLARREIRCVC
jgi:hypothetical protein